MKVTMLGTSSSGKTVFSAAVYSVFMSKDYKGLSLFPDGEGLRKQLIEDHKFRLSFESIAKKKWPIATVETTLYPLDLYLNDSKIANFDWLDYRGGLIDDPTLEDEPNNTAAARPASPQPPEEEIKKLEVQQQIAESNALILFVDAPKLVEPIEKSIKQTESKKGEDAAPANTDDITVSQPAMRTAPNSVWTEAAKNEAAYLTGIEAAMQVISGVAKGYPKSKLVILVALTKCDMLADAWKTNDFMRLRLLARDILAPLVNTIREKNKPSQDPAWMGGILPLSAMGDGQVIEEITQKSPEPAPEAGKKASSQTKDTAKKGEEPPNPPTPPENTLKITGFMAPYRVEHAIIYCIAGILRHEYDSVEAELDRRRTILSVEGLLERASSRMNGSDTQSPWQKMWLPGRLERYQRSLEKLLDQVSQIQEENDLLSPITSLTQARTDPQIIQTAVG